MTKYRVYNTGTIEKVDTVENNNVVVMNTSAYSIIPTFKEAKELALSLVDYNLKMAMASANNMRSKLIYLEEKDL